MRMTRETRETRRDTMAARRRWALAFVPAVLVACLALVDAGAEPYSLPGDPLWPTREQIQKLDVAVQGRVSRCVPHRARENACTPQCALHFSFANAALHELF